MTAKEVINAPPVYQPYLIKNGKIDDTWQKWFSSVYSVVNQFFPNFSYDHDTQGKVQGPVFSPPTYDTTTRDNLGSPSAGLVIYNTTTNKLNYYNGTTWMEV